MISIGISLNITLKIQKYMGFMFGTLHALISHVVTCACEKLSVHGLDLF